MAENSPLYPQVGRKTPGKGVRFNFAGPNLIWTTICSKNRGEWMAQQTVMDLLHGIWLNHATTWLVGDNLIMPDHLHFFAAPRDLRFSVERWFAFWKNCFSKSHSVPEWKWERGGFHHRLRSAEEFTEKWTYMMENSLRKGLVQNAEDCRGQDARAVFRAERGGSECATMIGSCVCSVIAALQAAAFWPPLYPARWAGLRNLGPSGLRLAVCVVNIAEFAIPHGKVYDFFSALQACGFHLTQLEWIAAP